MNFQRKVAPDSALPVSPASGAESPPIGVPAPSGLAVVSPTEGAGAPNSLTVCPDCDSSLVHRITDVDTGMSYPVDDGEAYCESCDHLWTADEIIPARPSTMTIEEAEARIASVFGLPAGWERVEI